MHIFQSYLAIEPLLSEVFEGIAFLSTQSWERVVYTRVRGSDPGFGTTGWASPAVTRDPYPSAGLLCIEFLTPT